MNEYPHIAGVHLPQVPDAHPVELVFDDLTLGGYLLEAWTSQRALLLLHGWGEDASSHLHAARFFRERGFHVLTLSLRGSRGSGGCDDYGLRQPHDTIRALNWLQARTGAQQLYLYGFSQGGLVALLTLAQGAPVTATAVLNAPTDVKDFARTTSFSFVTRYLEAVCADGLWQERSPLHQAGRIRAPVLIVASTADRQVRPEQSARLHALLPGSTLKTLPDEDHLPGETVLREVWEAVARFYDASSLR
ncbi:alpha/beta hydrolase family protein [Deinococcus peraridilitoris]|uniref:Prolyl oligopeptidase family protein n=1 Tax=Deinococcus peraridilitoris (strain DSM 19664 / LMG 22246 / CIP 109416 / KR-200) TaxID=937777 RepID=L0A2R7_DEIPD|nr:alpha/beta fold hydrolase [Deinococcus peraridilitoris]AFZ68173.1 prolyl oligopeptidase family protein [Deinococcus peraridilitoris DSM 19664]